VSVEEATQIKLSSKSYVGAAAVRQKDRPWQDAWHAAP
jgi:hypothetical protein